MRIYEIVPNKLYMSRKTNGVHVEKKLPQIKKLGIDVIVNLCCQKDTDLVYEVYEYIQFMQPDKVVPDVDSYDRMAQYLVKRINDGHCVLAHCSGGRNRSGFLASIIVMYLNNVPGETARKIVQERRPRSLSRKYITDLLDELELE